MRLTPALSLVLALAAASAPAALGSELRFGPALVPEAPVAPEPAPFTLELRDGRRFRVIEAVRRDGQVVFQTAAGRTFSVAEDQVVQPALEQLPAEILELADGRRLPVRSLARQGGSVYLETMGGATFFVPEDRVLWPPLARIPRLDGGADAEPAAGAAADAGLEAPFEPSPRPDPRPRGDRAQMAAPLPDRWSIAYPPDPRFPAGRAKDPYNQNRLKGDLPIAGQDLFLVLTGILDAPTEVRRAPVFTGVSTSRPDTDEFFGRGEQLFTTPRAFVSAELFKGQTAFKPKTWALKATLAANVNVLATRERNQVYTDVREDETRVRADLALEEAFAEVKLADLSPRYDAVSLRVGIQPFVTDARGFLFNDFNLGARLFGNLGANRWSFNLAAFDLLEKETNSELNTFEKRKQQVYVASLFRQDTFVKGFTLQASLHHSREAADTHYDKNGFLVRPARIARVEERAVRSTYFGLTGDGHFGRLNLTSALYHVRGTDENDLITGEEHEIRGWFAAAEASIDKDWARFKVSALWASGDGDPNDTRSEGFDVIYDLSNFAGGLFSYWTRTGVALTQTAVTLKPPGSLIPSLRSNKFEGQASFVNPGLQLLGVGVDVELKPELKLVTALNLLRFDDVDVLRLLLFQDRVRQSIGLDGGAGVIWRPLLNENVVVTAGVTGFLPGGGFRDIYRSSCAAGICGAPSKPLFAGFALVRLFY